LFLKDINLPTPDKYDTSQVVAFLQQMVTHEGFYDEDLEWVQLKSIQVVGSMAPSSTLGRHPLSTRFTANARVCAIDYPPTNDLQQVFSQLLNCAFAQPVSARSNDPKYDFFAPNKMPAESLRQLSAKLAASMVELYAAVKEKFTVDDRDHYIFTPRDLTAWIDQLGNYEVSSQGELLRAWGDEAIRVFRDRLLDSDRRNFDFMYQSVTQGTVQPPPSEGYWTALESVSDGPVANLTWTAAKTYEELLKQGNKLYNREVRNLPLFMFEEVLQHLNQIERILCRPAGNLLLIGRAGVGRRSAFSLVAYCLRLNVVTPHVNRNYNFELWKRDLKAVISAAGIEGQPTVLFIEDHQILQPAFLSSSTHSSAKGKSPVCTARMSWTNSSAR
jgi:dynein heavy chain 2